MKFVFGILMVFLFCIGTAIGLAFAIPFVAGWFIGRGVAEVLWTAHKVCNFYYEEW